MADKRWWAALVTFERLQEVENEILPDSALGGCGWMMAFAVDEDGARARIIRDVEHHGLRVIEIEGEQVLSGGDEIADLDSHLAANFLALEAGKQSVWGTIHAYKGEGSA